MIFEPVGPSNDTILNSIRLLHLWKGICLQPEHIHAVKFMLQRLRSECQTPILHNETKYGLEKIHKFPGNIREKFEIL